MPTSTTRRRNKPKPIIHQSSDWGAAKGTAGKATCDTTRTRPTGATMSECDGRDLQRRRLTRNGAGDVGRSSSFPPDSGPSLGALLIELANTTVSEDLVLRSNGKYAIWARRPGVLSPNNLYNWQLQLIKEKSPATGGTHGYPRGPRPLSF